MVDVNLIRRIEELSINAWPALQSVIWNGWLLRFAEGYSKRANSVNPLYASQGDIGESVAACERLYRCRELPTVFKMTPAVQPENLDVYLTRRGYDRIGSTSVQMLPLQNVDAETITRIEPFSQEWVDHSAGLRGLNERDTEILRRMLQAIVPTAGFATIERSGKAVTCGMGVVQDKFIGLFDIFTHVEHRNRGYARRLILDLLAWARERGAETAYLQVTVDNVPARRLYASLGFSELYRYWYRVRRQ